MPAGRGRAGGLKVLSAWFTKELHGWAIPTTVMPARGGVDRAEFLRIDGHRDDKRRINTCVAPGFACGLNPVIPAAIPESCRVREGAWTFLDFTSPACPLKHGFHAVVYSAPCDTRSCKKGGGQFGFFEAAEPVVSFTEFKRRVLELNAGRAYHAERVNLYFKSDGVPVEFVPHVGSDDEWGIVSLNYRAVERDTRKWGLAEGDLMTAGRDARVVVTNRRLGVRLVLDLSDALNPRRFWEAL